MSAKHRQMMRTQPDSVSPDAGEDNCSFSGIRSAINLIRDAIFFHSPLKKGLGSRAKERQKEKQELDLFTNQAISAVKQLATGRLSDELLQSQSKGFPEVKFIQEGAEISEIIRGKVSRA